ncbi:MAG: hypothetical protein A4E64_01475 [Syntrophorhabdus sp. PtaU1.Bin058]|nr:MAG: hypothetical protein A4E64_01475 [Syntrophorhabdus sp. PtaU1.Bin058]
MRAGLNDLETKLNSLQPEADRGIDYDGKRVSGSVSPGGLDFISEAPVPGPAHTLSPTGSGPVADSSVVDLRDMADKPLVVDPRKVAGPQPRSLPLPQRITDVAGDEELSYFTEDEIRSLLTPVQKGSAWPGPKNYEEPLINPLRDPERAKALYEADKAWINQRIKTLNGEEVLKMLNADERINKARDRIVREQVHTEYEVQIKAYRQLAMEIEGMMKALGTTESQAFEAKIKEDPRLQAHIEELVQRTKQSIAAGMKQARDKAYNDMYAEVTKRTKEQGDK